MTPEEDEMAGRMVRRADGRYQYALTITEQDGSRKRIYFYGSTQRAARRKGDEAAERLSAGSPLRDSSRTLEEWLVEWRPDLPCVRAIARSRPRSCRAA